MATQQKIAVMTQKGSFYGKLEQMFDQFPKYDIKILSGDFSTKLWRKDNLPHWKIYQESIFPYHNIHKYTWTFPDWKLVIR